VNEHFPGSDERPATGASRPAEDSDPDFPASVGKVPGIGDIGTFVEDKVISALESTVRTAPTNAAARVQLAKMYWRRAQTTKAPADRKRASDLFNEALRIDPNNSDAKEGLRQIAAVPEDADGP
jgi:hypothetical protein